MVQQGQASAGPASGSFLRQVARLMREIVFGGDWPADAATFFIGDTECPGDMRMVFQRGLDYPECMFGVLSRVKVRKYCDEDDQHVSDIGNLLFYDRWGGDGAEADVRSPQDDFCTPEMAVREGFRCRIRKLWRTPGGTPIGLLFVNYRRGVPWDFCELPSVRQSLLELYDAVGVLLGQYGKSTAARKVRQLTRQSNRICERLFFRSSDFAFDNMTRLERDRVFGRLVNATARRYFRPGNYWWTVHRPDADTQPMPPLTCVLKHGLPGLRRATATVATDKVDTLEAWVYRCDCPVRITDLRRTQVAGTHRLAALVSDRYHRVDGRPTASLISVPMESGGRVFAVVTVGVLRDGSGRPPAAESLTNAVRSLWVNGRRVSRFWRHSSESRDAGFSNEILDALRDSVSDELKDNQSGNLQNILREQFAASDCALWRLGTDRKFHRFVGDDQGSDRDRPRADGWTRRILQNGRPTLFRRDACGDEQDVEIYEWKDGDAGWTPVAAGAARPDIRPPSSRGKWLTQLGLPLRNARRSGRAFGVAWVFWDDADRLPLPKQVDPQWASQCTDKVALLLDALQVSRDLVARQADGRLDDIMHAMRHDVLAKVPVILKSEIQALRLAGDAPPLAVMEDAVNLLFAALNYYTAFHSSGGALQKVHHAKRENVLVVVDRAKRWSVHFLERPAIEIVVEESGDPGSPTDLFATIDQEALAFILLNLLLNAKQYLKLGPNLSDAERYAPVYVRVRRRGDAATSITVDDAGRCMSAEQIPLIGRERFKASGNHLGIGLLLCAKLLGSAGQLTAARNERGGMNFIITFKERSPRDGTT